MIGGWWGNCAGNAPLGRDAKGKHTRCATRKKRMITAISRSDLVPVYLTDERIAKIRAALPNCLPRNAKRYVSEFGLPEYDAGVLTMSKYTAKFFEDSVAISLMSQKSKQLYYG